MFLHKKKPMQCNLLCEALCQFGIVLLRYTILLCPLRVEKNSLLVIIDGIQERIMSAEFGVTSRR